MKHNIEISKIAQESGNSKEVFHAVGGLTTNEFTATLEEKKLINLTEKLDEDFFDAVSDQFWVSIKELTNPPLDSKGNIVENFKDCKYIQKRATLHSHIVNFSTEIINNENCLVTTILDDETRLFTPELFYNNGYFSAKLIYSPRSKNIVEIYGNERVQKTPRFIYQLISDIRTIEDIEDPFEYTKSQVNFQNFKNIITQLRENNGQK